MNCMEGLTWTCHICGDERPDALISVRKVPAEMGGVNFEQNVRYCNDRPACAEASKTYSFNTLTMEAAARRMQQLVKLASDLTQAEYDAMMATDERPD